MHVVEQFVCGDKNIETGISCNLRFSASFRVCLLSCIVCVAVQRALNTRIQITIWARFTLNCVRACDSLVETLERTDSVCIIFVIFKTMHVTSTPLISFDGTCHIHPSHATQPDNYLFNALSALAVQQDLHEHDNMVCLCGMFSVFCFSTRIRLARGITPFEIDMK